MQITLEKYGAFWFFMCCTLLGIVFVYFLLPETKGKTLEDIEKLFSKKYDADGTLKAPEVQVSDKHSEGKTASVTLSVIAFTNNKPSLFRQNKGDDNEIVGVAYGEKKYDADGTLRASDNHSEKKTVPVTLFVTNL